MNSWVQREKAGATIAFDLPARAQGPLRVALAKASATRLHLLIQLARSEKATKARIRQKRPRRFAQKTPRKPNPLVPGSQSSPPVPASGPGSRFQPQPPTSGPGPRSQLPIQAPASSLARRISTATLPNVLILRLVTQPSFLEIDSRELIPRRTASEDSPRSHRRILAFVRKIRRDHAHPQARHRRPQASSPE